MCFSVLDILETPFSCRSCIGHRNTVNSYRVSSREYTIWGMTKIGYHSKGCLLRRLTFKCCKYFGNTPRSFQQNKEACIHDASNFWIKIRLTWNKLNYLFTIRGTLKFFGLSRSESHHKHCSMPKRKYKVIILLPRKKRGCILFLSFIDQARYCCSELSIFYLEIISIGDCFHWNVTIYNAIYIAFIVDIFVFLLRGNTIIIFVHASN